MSASTISSFRSAIVPVLLLGLVAGCDKQVSGNRQAEATPTASAPVAAAPKADKIDRTHKGDPAPSVSFEGPDGKPMTLARFKGKPVLVNLWATWCGPCVKEMPTLDAAAADITVAAISQDKDRPTIDAYFAKNGFQRLKPYLDKNVALSVTYEASLPMSILFDSTGHEVWRSTGGMDWTSAKAKALLAEAK
jgi:thiol-disulfide isomerase/thioredoxin